QIGGVGTGLPPGLERQRAGPSSAAGTCSAGSWLATSDCRRPERLCSARETVGGSSPAQPIQSAPSASSCDRVSSGVAGLYLPRKALSLRLRESLMRASLFLLLTLPLLGGCATHCSLRENTLKTSATLTDLNYQQVLDNVA